MKKLLALIVVAGLGVYGYEHHRATLVARSPSEAPVRHIAPLSSRDATASAPAPATPQFSCDGRTHCSQMRSCEEARYFLHHCPGTEMDGDNDGVPCERQWCRL
jgi:hypothetical protein